VQLPAGTKKPVHKPESRDTATVSASTNAQKLDGILKPQTENVPKNVVALKVHKGISTRYGRQAEVKEQNQHLMATNEDLQKNLTEIQQRVAELELQYSDLVKENTEVQKNLKDCHVLLVSANIDPGERVGEASRNHEDQRKEVMEIQATMTELTKARQHMMQERENFSLKAAEMEQALKEAEALLL
ncbi:hypothetical protein FQN60_015545, partial [Etheostoma spectabile]